MGVLQCPWPDARVSPQWAAQSCQLFNTACCCLLLTAVAAVAVGGCPVSAAAGTAAAAAVRACPLSAAAAAVNRPRSSASSWRPLVCAVRQTCAPTTHQVRSKATGTDRDESVPCNWKRLQQQSQKEGAAAGMASVCSRHRPLCRQSKLLETHTSAFGAEMCVAGTTYGAVALYRQPNTLTYTSLFMPFP